jgi:uncharacterized coiled-coil protein SlyX
MAKKSQALIAAEQRIAELEARCAALEARLVVARECFTNQRTHIRELEAELNTRGTKRVAAEVPAAPRASQPIVTRFVRRDGVTCERTRYGNRSVVREVASGSVPGIEVVYQQ